MSQLGSGQGSSFPFGIDTRQIFENSPDAGPDSSSRIDAQIINDLAAANINAQTALGANVQGVFASLAARLNQFIPGGGIVPNVVSFLQRTVFTIAGAVHHLGSRAILYQVYDTNVPRQAVNPTTVTVSPTTYDLTVTFPAPQDGTVVLASPSPQYTTTFAGVTTLTILGSAHGLGTADLFYKIYNAADPAAVIQSPTLTSVTVHPTTFDVVITFASSQSGSLILSPGGARHRAPFASVSSISVPGATHQLGSAALLFQLYTNATPAVAFAPSSFTVDPVTFNVVATFGATQSGALLLAAVPEGSGHEFAAQDAGVVNQTAVRVYSDGGALNLQAGSADLVQVRNKTGAVTATFDTLNGRLGLGTASPTHQLTLTTDSAIKASTNTWQVLSDDALKTVIGPFTDGLPLLLQLCPILFRYNGKGGTPLSTKDEIGFSAQALQPVAPYMVKSHRGRLAPNEDERDLLTYDGHAMVFILLNAVKELAARVTALEAANAALQVHQKGVSC